MRYVIMANGKGSRWNNYEGIPKHLISIGGETLLQRTTRLVHSFDSQAEVIITSRNPDCVAEGARRYEPLRSQREIDRFCVELIQDGHSKEGPYGAKSIGEVAYVPPAAAVCAAVNNALNSNIGMVPIDPPVILKALEGGK